MNSDQSAAFSEIKDILANYDLGDLLSIERNKPGYVNTSYAIETMKRALQEFVIEPIKTTIPACLDILSHNLFVKKRIDTGFVERIL